MNQNVADKCHPFWICSVRDNKAQTLTLHKNIDNISTETGFKNIIILIKNRLICTKVFQPWGETVLYKMKTMNKDETHSQQFEYFWQV